MKREINLLTLSYLVFLLMLSVASLFDGIFHTVVYILAFLLPLFLALYLLSRYVGKENVLNFEYLTLGREHIASTAALVFPTTLAVFILSLLTSLLVYFTVGATDTVELGDSLILALLLHALLPAVLEELLFRYLPMKAIGKQSPRVTVFISAIFFAFVHHSFFSIPYAFAAGVVFITADLAMGSVIPSVIMHLCNNALSVTWIMYSDAEHFAAVFFSGLALLALVSIVYIVIKREKYVSMIQRAFARAERYAPSYEPLLFIVPTLIIAISELIA